MFSKSKPYVGITGPTSESEVKGVLNAFSEAGYSMETLHIPMLGFLVSYKTLNNQPVSNRRYPPLGNLPGLLFESYDKVMTMIHYNSQERDSLVKQVEQLFDEIYSNGLCKALQLNIVWPDAVQVKKIKAKLPELKIVLQLSHTAMEQAPDNLIKRVEEYGKSIDYVLIDPSGGRGKEFDIENSLKIYNELSAKTPDIMVGFAGGFTGDSVETRLKDIINKTNRTDFCIDAEGGLRDKLSDEYGDDLLNIGKVKDYLKNAHLVLP